MALTECPDCKKEVSSIAEFCPDCGRSSGKRQIVNVDLGISQGVRIAFGFLAAVCSHSTRSMTPRTWITS